MSRVGLALCAVLCAAAAYVAQASEYAAPHLVELTATNFEEETTNGKVHFVVFYAPWCGHCKRLQPTWKELGAKFADSTEVSIGHVDCTAHRAICTKNDVKGYPTLKILYKGEEYKTYRGPRELAALEEFVQDAAKDLLKETD